MELSLIFLKMQLLFPNEIVAESDPNFTRADEAKIGREREVFETCKLAENAQDMSNIKMLTNSVFGKLMVEVAESIAYDLKNPFVVMVKIMELSLIFLKMQLLKLMELLIKMEQKEIIMEKSLHFIKV